MPVKKPLSSTPVFAPRRFPDAVPSARDRQIAALVQSRSALPPPKNVDPKGPFPGPGGNRPDLGPIPGDIPTVDPLIHGPISLALPISLTSSFTLASGGSDSPPLLPLKASTPVEIREIRVLLTKAETVARQNLGGVVGLALDLDGVKLSEGPVPVALLCEREQSELGWVAATTARAQYVWRLPEPLYIPKGAILRPVFQHAGFLAEDITIQVSYCGNVALGQPPRVMRIPWVSFWSGKGLTVSDSDSNDPTQLANPFDTPLCVEAIHGRLVALYTATFGADALNLALESDAGAHAAAGLTVELRDSAGRQFVPNATPFWQVFESSHRSLNVPFILAPREYLLAEIETDTSLSTGVRVIPQIALCGWVEVKRS